MKRKIVIPLVVITVVAVLVITLVFIFMPTPPGPGSDLETGSRKAIILCSANDFYAYEAEDDFNSGDQSTFDSESGRWVDNFTNGYGGQDTVPGKDGLPGALHLIANTSPDPTGYVNLEYTYNWTNFHSLNDYASTILQHLTKIQFLV